MAVFGSDDRVVLPAEKRTLELSVGLLYEQRSRTICTAFCVAPGTIATAGHCFFRTAGEPALKLSGFVFRIPGARPRRESRIEGTRASTGGQFVTAGTHRLSVSPPIDAVDDWALARLADPVCGANALPVSRRPADELVRLSAQGRIYQVGYHRDFGNWQLAYGAPCAVRRSFPTADWRTISRDFSHAEHLILHDCDTGGASSGSPLLMDSGQGPEVVGISVGTYVQSKVLTQNGSIVHRYKSSSIANTGVASAAFETRLDQFLKADLIESSDGLKALQELLSQVGYYKGPKDGSFGAQLRRAIELFEEREGRPVTGLATASLLSRLKALAAEQNERLRHIETGSIGSHRLTGGAAANR